MQQWRLMAAIAVAGLLTCSSSAAVWYVRVDGDDGAAGTDWTTAFRTISNAVAGSVAGDTVVVSNGTYGLTAQINITKSIVVTSLMGRAQTSINGSGTVYCVNVNNAGAVLDGFTISNANRGVTLSAGVVQNCDIFDCRTNNGVYMTGGLLTNCNISRNLSTNRGGGIYMHGGLVANCAITYNVCSNRGGGGLSMYGGRLEDCDVGHNTAIVPGAGISGGGIYTEAGGIRVYRCNIFSNTATYFGGGLYFCGGARIHDSHIFGNSMTNTLNRGGGGAYLRYGAMSNCTITGNTVYPNTGNSDGGGIVIQDGGSVLNCIINSNRSLTASAYGGGGVRCWNGGVLRQCVIGYNSARYGAGVYFYHVSGSSSLESCLVVGNNASSRGGGLDVSRAAGSTRVMNCTIVMNRAVNQGGGIYKGGAHLLNTIVYSNESANFPVNANWGDTFAGSATNCCTTPTLAGFGPGNITDEPVLRDWLNADYSLAPCSPCIDNGDNQSWMTNRTDLGGMSRIFPTGGTVDMGAYEFRPSGSIFISW